MRIARVPGMDIRIGESACRIRRIIARPLRSGRNDARQYHRQSQEWHMLHDDLLLLAGAIDRSAGIALELRAA
jgi:hypothetical protein